MKYSALFLFLLNAVACQSRDPQSDLSSKMTPGVERRMELQLLVKAQGRQSEEVEAYLANHQPFKQCLSTFFQKSAVRSINLHLKGKVAADGKISGVRASSSPQISLLEACAQKVGGVAMKEGLAGSWEATFAPPGGGKKSGPRVIIDIREPGVKIQQ